MKILLMADGAVGTRIAEWLIQHYPQDIGIVVSIASNAITEMAETAGIPSHVFTTQTALVSHLEGVNQDFDYGILAWWPRIIKNPLLRLPRKGFINTHPSLLPHNRGKHYNFWALVERAPFGVSLHFVEEGIDCGDVIAQLPIPCSWEDNGATLYAKASQATFELFRETYPGIRTDSIRRVPQDVSKGSFHLAREIDSASQIDLERQYGARDLLNLLRARTFPGYPACWFTESGEVYEVRIDIKRKTQ